MDLDGITNPVQSDDRSPRASAGAALFTDERVAGIIVGVAFLYLVSIRFSFRGVLPA